MNRPSAIIAVLVLTAAILTSCNGTRFFEENKKIDNASWAAHNKQSFTVVIDDTSALYDVHINIRNDVSYPFSNLFLFLKTRFPGEGTAQDTIECLLASPDGSWLGTGMGRVRFSSFLFQQGVRFLQPGTYRFDFEQAMRTDPLTGITDIGIRIDKHPASIR